MKRSSEKHAQWLKKLFIPTLIAAGLLMPELLWHKLSFVLHVLYEVASFLLEESLIHGLGMQKYYAQMAVFYFFWLLGIVLFAAFLGRLPGLLQAVKARIRLFALQIKDHIIETWLASNVWQKLKFLTLQLALTAGGIIWLMA